MTTVIDEQGNLFGYVNVIDALFVMVILAVVVAGVSLATQPGRTAPPEPAQMAFEFAAEVTPPVAVAMVDRQPTTDAVRATRVTDIGPVRTIHPNSQEVLQDGQVLVLRDGEPKQVRTVRFTATIPVVAADGTWQYRGDRLLIGQTYSLDLGYTIVDATLLREVDG